MVICCTIENANGTLTMKHANIGEKIIKSARFIIWRSLRYLDPDGLSAFILSSTVNSRFPALPLPQQSTYARVPLAR
jgi:hypothetical protein